MTVLMTIVVVGTIVLAITVDVGAMIAWLRQRTAPAWGVKRRPRTTAE
jgi:hypothetical protein